MRSELAYRATARIAKQQNLPGQINHPFHNTYKIAFRNILDYVDHSRNKPSIEDYVPDFVK